MCVYVFVCACACSVHVCVAMYIVTKLINNLIEFCKFHEDLT